MDNQIKAVRAAAIARGYEGRSGGWIYDPNGRCVCQGWSNFAKRTYVDWISSALRHGALGFHMDQQITVDGERWRIVSIGAHDEQSDLVLLHLASTTKFREQKNRQVPIQTQRWVAARRKAA